MEKEAYVKRLKMFLAANVQGKHTICPLWRLNGKGKYTTTPIPSARGKNYGVSKEACRMCLDFVDIPLDADMCPCVYFGKSALSIAKLFVELWDKKIHKWRRRV